MRMRSITWCLCGAAIVCAVVGGGAAGGEARRVGAAAAGTSPVAGAPAPPPPTPTMTPVPALGRLAAEGGDWGPFWIGIEGCSFFRGSEPNVTVCVAIAACVSRTAAGIYRGDGKGRYTRCGYVATVPATRYEVTCPDFTAPVTVQVLKASDEELARRRREYAGTLQHHPDADVRLRHTLRVKLDASRVVEQAIMIAFGRPTTLVRPAFMQMGFGSALRNNGGILCETPPIYQAKVVKGSDAVAAGHLTYEFHCWYRDSCDWSLDEFVTWTDWHATAQPPAL